MISLAGSLPLVNGFCSIAWQRIKMACCNEKLSGAPLMAVYSSDCKTTRNPPKRAKQFQLNKGLTVQHLPWSCVQLSNASRL
uniref:Uncharacterized protein n=1 Tax=Arundo donax TaxID=35708 RepID=A0A0A9FZI3_ARUDO